MGPIRLTLDDATVAVVAGDDDLLVLSVRRDGEDLEDADLWLTPDEAGQLLARLEAALDGLPATAGT